MAEKESCIFCDIVAGKAEAYKVFEDEKSLCILDIQSLHEGPLPGDLQEACALVHDLE